MRLRTQFNRCKSLWGGITDKVIQNHHGLFLPTGCYAIKYTSLDKSFPPSDAPPPKTQCTRTETKQKEILVKTSDENQRAVYSPEVAMNGGGDTSTTHDGKKKKPSTESSNPRRKMIT
jgi:hypothetical protein